MEGQKFVVGAALLFLATTAGASEYCQKKFYDDIKNVNGEAANLLIWQKDAQTAAGAILSKKKEIDAAMSNAISSETASAEVKLELVRTLNDAKKLLNKKEQEIIDENVNATKRLVELKTSIPENLRAKAKECAREVAPANLVVNLVVQGLAAFFTDGTTLLLPNKKALYIDMGEVLNGNLPGGDKSIVNETKDWLNSQIVDLPFKF